jgi:hypothetical protein
MLCEKLKSILELHRGKRNAIPSRKISEMIDYPMEDIQSATRRILHLTAEKYNLPLISCRKGFYIAETEEELAEYNRCIDSRIREMNRRRNLANTAFRKAANK